MLLEKLLSGKLKKHSEQLNKFLAGFFDTDGSVFVTLDRNVIQLRSNITQAASQDPDFEVMRALQKHYNLGSICYFINNCGTSACNWVMGIKDSKKLYNLISKHLNIKATYFETCIYLQDTLHHLTAEQWADLKCLLKLDRNLSKYLKRPKHLSWAYTAGVIAGDGHLRCKTYRRKDRPQYPCHRLDVILSLKDKVLVELFRESFRGCVNQENNCDAWRWQRGLGKNNKKFALEFLPKIRKYMLLKTKRNVIDRMLAFNNILPAETKQADAEMHN